VRGVYTNTVPVDAYRGAGRPEAAYVIERLVDHAAREVGIAPDALRRRNFVNQVHGGTAQGIGQALMEHAVYDPDSGQLMTASLMDYAVPRANEVPAITFETRNVPCTHNPLGVKGAGEAGAIGSCPAVMNAIVDALWRAQRIAQLDMPATPQRLWSAIKNRS
jgi:CO/xanthine dehydrogenase Mo-binding subunit